jgi:hypothetical protein
LIRTRTSAEDADYLLIIQNQRLTIISAAGSFAYIIDTVKGKVKPNRVSFLLWAIAPMIAFAAQIGKGVGIESLMTLSVGILPLMIFGSSFINKKAEWKLTQFDLICGFLSIVGLIFWLITQEGNIAIAFSIIADGLAAIPTVVKAYKYPETEVAWPWLTASFGVIITLLTLNQLTFANSAFIIYIFIANTTIFSLVQFKLGKRASLQH